MTMATRELTDKEILMCISEASLRCPLNQQGYETAKYYFKKVAGDEAYKQVFGDQKIDMDEVDLRKHKVKIQ